jgi:hypothetical protein
MDVVLLAVIGLVLLLGLVAIAIGNKGWSWGTVAAAILLLLAATGYLYLAARLAERERSWREKIAKSQAEIDRINPPDGAANGKSLASLRNQRDRWTRALAFVDTWHGRAWDKATLTPPRDGKPGTISIEMASEESELAPLSAGAEVAVFDNANVEDEGRFLGLFRVQAVKANKGDENCLLTIVPAATPAPPSERDSKLWTRPYDEVTVYESLPVDRWLAFHRTPVNAAGAAADDAEGSSASRWMPQPQKTSGEDSLKSLEEQMEALAQHDKQVPEDEWPQLGEKLLSNGKPGKYLKRPDGTDEIHPGRYWAVVEFTKNVLFKKQGGKLGGGEFTLDDAGAAEPGSEDDEDVGAPGEPIGAAIGETVGGGADAGGDGEASGPEPTAGAVTKRFKQKRFKEGEQAEFDLQTALELQNDKQWVRITSVTERRPLSDPFTAIRGTAFSAKADNGQPVRADGIDAIRQELLVEMESIAQATIRVKTSHDNVEVQSKAVADEKQQLDSDLTSWGKDVTAATETAAAFDDRLRAATIELAALENSIVRLGKELSGAWASLTERVDAATR